MQRRWQPALLALLALVAGAPALGDVAPYTAPANVSVDNPFGPDGDVELQPIDFVVRVPATTRFDVEARDKAAGPVWLRACIIYENTCQIHGAANDALTLKAVPGTGWPVGTVARVWVSTARVSASGDPSLATWGGLRAQFSPGGEVDDIAPYVASGQAGRPDLQLALGSPRSCGDALLGAACATLPFDAKRVHVALHDAAVASASFEACVIDDGTALACRSGTTDLTLVGTFPAGATVDVRPYAWLGTQPAATKGHAHIRYYG